jgi:hypothetical protein
MQIALPTTSPPSAPLWAREEWHARRWRHLERVGTMAEAFVERRSRGARHPVHDFLFTYYTFSPAKLIQWVPPHGVAIEIDDEELGGMPWLERLPIRRSETELALDSTGLTKSIQKMAADVAALCGGILQRPARFGCHGLHEWAMVYRQSAVEVRHGGYELRMTPDDLASFVESQAICCSHYDAYRFFTPGARPLNALQPTLESRTELEQGGCLHTNMDLYKWSAKLWPWIGSDLIGRTFALACEGRELDMRASPYDLSALGYTPIRIETPEGREEYVLAQRALAEKAEPMREELKRAADVIAAWR